MSDKPEIHTFTTDVGNKNMYSAGSVVSICTVPHGDTNHTRTGKKIVVKGILIRGSITAGTTQTVPQLCWIGILQEVRPRGSLPSVTDFQENDANPIHLPADTEPSRFRMLKKEVWRVVGDGDTLTNAFESKHWVNIYRKCNIPVEWRDSNTDGAYGDLTWNGLCLVQGGSGSANDTTVPLSNTAVRIYYSDA